MSIKIEIAGESDAEQLAALHYLSHKVSFAPFASPEWVASLEIEYYNQRWHESMSTAATDTRARTWKATDPDVGDDVIGMVRISEMSQQEAQLTSMHVHPDFQRRGIGSMLMDAAMDFLHEAGYETAILGVILENTPARVLYERRGWKVVEVRPKGIEGVPVATCRISLTK